MASDRDFPRDSHLVIAGEMHRCGSLEGTKMSVCRAEL